MDFLLRTGQVAKACPAPLLAGPSGGSPICPCCGVWAPGKRMGVPRAGGAVGCVSPLLVSRTLRLCLLVPQTWMPPGAPWGFGHGLGAAEPAWLGLPSSSSPSHLSLSPLLPPYSLTCTSCSPGPGPAGWALGVSTFLLARGRGVAAGQEQEHPFCSALWLTPARCSTHACTPRSRHPRVFLPGVFSVFLSSRV